MRTTLDIEYKKTFKLFDIKVVGIIALILAIFSLIIAVYCQIEIMPYYEVFDRKTDLQEFDRAIWRTYADQKFLFGNIALFLGSLAAILGLIVGLKNYKIGWLAIVMGLIAFSIGAAQSTNMFS